MCIYWHISIYWKLCVKITFFWRKKIKFFKHNLKPLTINYTSNTISWRETRFSVQSVNNKRKMQRHIIWQWLRIFFWNEISILKHVMEVQLHNICAQKFDTIVYLMNDEYITSLTIISCKYIVWFYCSRRKTLLCIVLFYFTGRVFCFFFSSIFFRFIFVVFLGC